MEIVPVRAHLGARADRSPPALAAHLEGLRDHVARRQGVIVPDRELALDALRELRADLVETKNPLAEEAAHGFRHIGGLAADVILLAVAANEALADLRHGR